MTNLTRRDVLRGLGVAGAALATGCGTSGASSGGGGLTPLRIGIIALTDCSPIVIAKEKGFFEKHGLDVTIVKGANWAAIRDSLSNGDLDATHMLLGMPIASTIGLGGSPKVPMVVPWLLNRNGQAITTRKGWSGVPKPGETYAMTFPSGTHAMWMRYFLASHGVHPDKDVSLITIPPPQMVANMKVGKMDGFCVGEPWNTRAVKEDIGQTTMETAKLWPDHPEKVCAFKREYADKNPEAVKSVLKALHEASAWLDDTANRDEHATLVSKTTYINCEPELIKAPLGESMIFSKRNCNYPQKKYAIWFLTQFRRWGMLEGKPDYEAIAAEVMRPDLYEDAMKELGVTHGGPDFTPETLFDGITFDPAKPEEYALGFAVHGVKG